MGCNYHVVFVPKRRCKALRDDIAVERFLGLAPLLLQLQGLERQQRDLLRRGIQQHRNLLSVTLDTASARVAVQDEQGQEGADYRVLPGTHQGKAGTMEFSGGPT